jgi:L-glyceraldehyde 3-phosphate reductase
MQYRRLGKWGLKLPEISLGLWRNFGGTAPLGRSREIARGGRAAGAIRRRRGAGRAAGWVMR